MTERRDLAKSGAGLSSYILILMSAAMVIVFCPNFWETLPRLMLIQEGTKVSVALNEDKSRKEMVEEYILYQIEASGESGIPFERFGQSDQTEIRGF